MQGPADLLIINGTILTMNSRRPRASWLAVVGPRIAGVGHGGSAAWIGPQTRIVDLAGRTAIPGLADTHCHVASNAHDDRNVECRDFFVRTDSVRTILARMKAASDAATGDEWIVAVGSPMQQTRLRELRLPRRDELDAAVPDRPAYATFGAHVLVANRHALAAGGIGPTTPDPAGGIIERDDAGTPTGVMRETAQALIKRRRPGPEPDLVQRLRSELQRCAARGVTTIHDIVKSEREIQAYLDLERAGRLPVRVQVIPRVVQAEFEPWSFLDAEALRAFDGDFVRFGGVKVSVDGGSTAGQAVFYPTPYDPPAWRPILRMHPGELDELVRRYNKAGIRMCIHAVGDRALDIALHSLEAALSADERSDHRHRVEHMGNWLLTDERRSVARRYGIVPVPNPASLYFVGRSAVQSVGAQRMSGAYALRTLLDEGFPLAFGSDGGGYWAVDPLRDIAASASRQALDGTIVGPEQAITVQEGLIAETRTAAWLGFVEDRLGQLTEGMLADIAVLAADPLTAAIDDLRTMRVDLTVTNGRIVQGAA